MITRSPRSLDDFSRDARVLVRKGGQPDPEGACVVYWMQRAQRATDNPALNVAVELGNLLRKPVVVFVSLVPFYPNSNLRSYWFFVQGLADVREGLRRKNVGFILRRWPEDEVDKFCAQARACVVIGDENPMREPERWRHVLARRLRMPFWTVDADVIVPSALLQKEQYAARTIRPRIRTWLDHFLVPPGNPKAQVAWQAPKGMQTLAAGADLLTGFPIDTNVQPVAGSHAGSRAAMHCLRRFVRQGLTGYATQRNRPDLDGTSRLSHYLHFGHIGPHTVALAVIDAGAPRADRDAFLEQVIVRRELAVNFVKFNPHYDGLQSAEPWAAKTLNEHRRDEREVVYSETQFEDAETNDPLWNAAQQQMVTCGWMHGYLRMYWAKKILEWTETPEQAFEIAVWLNDRYELDGRDPNGYAGIAWAIAGKHDRAWGPERPVYGKIRYMSYAGTSRKFDARGYIQRVSMRQG